MKTGLFLELFRSLVLYSCWLVFMLFIMKINKNNFMDINLPKEIFKLQPIILLLQLFSLSLELLFLPSQELDQECCLVLLWLWLELIHKLALLLLCMFQCFFVVKLYSRKFFLNSLSLIIPCMFWLWQSLERFLDYSFNNISCKNGKESVFKSKYFLCA